MPASSKRLLAAPYALSVPHIRQHRYRTSHTADASRDSHFLRQHRTLPSNWHGSHFLRQYWIVPSERVAR
eukprot:1012696-Rhodomonas_salina.3